MQPSLEKLRKFFRLEHENTYENTAIIGGLAKMLDYWEGEARADGVAEEVIQAVVSRLRSYEKLNPTGRADSLKGLWKRIAETYPEAGQKPKVQTQPQRPSQPQRPQRSDDEAQPKAEESESAPAQSQSQPRQNPPQQYQQKQRQAPPPRFEAATSAKQSQTPAAFSAELTVLQGVGPKNAESLANLGMKTLGDMLYYFPRRYEDYSLLKPIQALMYGDVETVLGTIQSIHNRQYGGSKSLIEVIISDGTGSLRISFFNQPWLVNRLKQGEAIAVSGKIDQYLGLGLSEGYRAKLARFRYGPGVCKADWALAGPIPWKADTCRRAGTVHLGGSLEEIGDAIRDAHEGWTCRTPYVVLAQQSLFDPSRAPAGRHRGPPPRAAQRLCRGAAAYYSAPASLRGESS